MNKELIEKARIAFQFCIKHGLFLPKEFEAYKQDPPKLMAASIARMELYQRAHNELKGNLTAKSTPKART